MTVNELNIFIEEGEGYKIEFKESLSNLSKELVAFANSSGGRVFLGVNDKGKIIETPSKMFKRVAKAVSKGNVSIVRVLVEAGADVTIPNKYGKTAIEEAQESGYEEIVQILANQH